MLYNVPIPPSGNAAAVRAVPLSIGIVLLPEFAMQSFGALLDTLRHASRMAQPGEGVCSWTVMGPDHSPVSSSSGMRFTPSEVFGQPERFHYIAVVGGEKLSSTEQIGADLIQYIQAASSRGTAIVGVGSGSGVLIEADLLGGGPVCCHWLAHAEYAIRYPHIDVRSDQIFIDHGKHISCAGGAATADMAFLLLQKHCSDSHARFAANVAMIEKARRGTAAQSSSAYTADIANDRVRRAIALIQLTMDSPLTVGELANKVSLSKRQLERLFQKYLGAPVQSISRQMRLQNGLFLLLRTNKTITCISQECGFADSSHFTRKFVEAFDMRPSQLRKDSDLAEKLLDNMANENVHLQYSVN